MAALAGGGGEITVAALLKRHARLKWVDNNGLGAGRASPLTNAAADTAVGKHFDRAFFIQAQGLLT